jgi:hypothetical protein
MRLPIASSVAMTALLLALTLTTGASAAVPGYELVTKLGPYDSASPKEFTAPCTAPKRLIGAGGAAVHADNDPAPNPRGEVLTDGVIPNQPIQGQNLTEVKIHADEDQDGYPAGWRINAYAICANPLPGLELVDTFVFNTGPFPYAKAYASCPGTKRVVGAAADIIGGDGEVVLDDVVPNADLTEVSVTAWEDQDRMANFWGLDAYAICAQPPSGLQRVRSFPSTDRSEAVRVASAQCPAGKKLLGLGAALSRGGGNDGDTTGGAGQVALTRLAPFLDGSRSFVRAEEDQDGTSQGWRLGAYAICATV